MASAAPESSNTEERIPRIGELAVQRAMVSQEHLDLCVEYQRQLRRSGISSMRLGEVLVEKKLLTPEQVEELLAIQRKLREADNAQTAARFPAGRRDGKAGRRWPRLAPGLISFQIGPGHVLLLAVLLPAGALYALSALPGPSRRALTRYLETCSEESVQPDHTLATRKFHLLVRDFEVGRFDPVITHDYSPELRLLTAMKKTTEWANLAESVNMPAAKQSALLLAMPILPDRLTPANTERLVIEVQMAACQATLKAYGAERFETRSFRFLMIRVFMPRWDSGWRVADYTPIG